ncbi:MAG: IS630 family transposase [Phycisphaerales bacterium]|nr:IS630 family transposase [Phycisphaerales bacterium]
MRVSFIDEARFGQKGTLTKVWAKKGSRPTVIRQTRYENAYLYAAVDPATRDSSALVAPRVNTETMSAFLKLLSAEVGPHDHVVLVLDRAGWHVSTRLEIPANLTLLHLPPYSPELNPVERLWLYLKSHFLSNRVFTDYDHLLQAGTDAYRALEPQRDRLKSICATAWLTPGIQT